VLVSLYLNVRLALSQLFTVIEKLSTSAIPSR
jgi:hypothetical protein